MFGYINADFLRSITPLTSLDKIYERHIIAQSSFVDSKAKSVGSLKRKVERISKKRKRHIMLMCTHPKM